MKLTAIILLTACLTASAKSFSQKVTLSVKEASLESVFTEIKKQTGYSIFYNYRLLENVKPVTIKVKDVTIADALKECLKNQPLDFEIADKSIVIKEKSPNVITTNEPPPPIDIHGKVANEKGEPVAGASVKVKDSNKGTSTNDDGEFTLTGVDNNATLVISGVNIETFEVKVNGRNDLAVIAAKTRTITGEEVTLNTGYQQLKPNTVTGSVDVVDDKLINRRVSTNILDRLENLTSGVSFKNPNDGLLIRGRSTIYSNPSPLIVVDNFPYD